MQDCYYFDYFTAGIVQSGIHQFNVAVNIKLEMHSPD